MGEPRAKMAVLWRGGVSGSRRQSLKWCDDDAPGRGGLNPSLHSNSWTPYLQRCSRGSRFSTFQGCVSRSWRAGTRSRVSSKPGTNCRPPATRKPSSSLGNGCRPGGALSAAPATWSCSLAGMQGETWWRLCRSEEHTSELQSPCNLVCRLLLEKKKNTHNLIAAAAMTFSLGQGPDTNASKVP